MNTKEITWVPGYELVEMIRSGELSAVVVAKHYLDRIQQFEPVLHAYISVQEEMVLAEAKAIDEAIARGGRSRDRCADFRSLSRISTITPGTRQPVGLNC